MDAEYRPPVYVIKHRFLKHFCDNGVSVHPVEITRRVCVEPSGESLESLRKDRAEEERLIEEKALELDAPDHIAKEMAVRAMCGDWTHINVKPGEWFSCRF